jgi:hypothetical protein
MTRIVTVDEISEGVLSACFNPYGTHRQRVAAAITAWLAEQSAPKPGHVTPPAPEPETREVRIAVAIDTNGNAGVAVVTHGDDAEALEYAGEWTDTLIAAQGIVTARIPVIAIPVISGTVEAV